MLSFAEKETNCRVKGIQLYKSKGEKVFKTTFIKNGDKVDVGGLKIIEFESVINGYGIWLEQYEGKYYNKEE